MIKGSRWTHAGEAIYVEADYFIPHKVVLISPSVELIQRFVRIVKFNLNWQVSDLLSVDLKIAVAIFRSSTRPFSVAVGVLCRCCVTEHTEEATFWTEVGQEQTPGGCLTLMKNWGWDLRRSGLMCFGVHMWNSHHLPSSTRVIKVSHTLHFIKCRVTPLCSARCLPLAFCVWGHSRLQAGLSSQLMSGDLPPFISPLLLFSSADISD